MIEDDPIVAWALAQGETLARAAREGYDVRGPVVDALCQRVATFGTKALIAFGLGNISIALRENSPAWNDASWETRTPNAAAFAAHDAVKAALAEVDRPEGVRLELLPVQRFRERPFTPPVTVILVKVLADGVKERAVVFPVLATAP